jgi:diguanylate cyclase (GGDEF)-like protein
VRAVRDATGRLRETHTDSRDVTGRMRDDAEREALARVTAAVAAAADVDRVADMVAREAAVLSGAATAEVVRSHGDEGLVVGAAGALIRAGDRVPREVADADALAVPVAVEGRPWGLVRTRGTTTPDPRDEERLRALADLVALAVANARTRARLVALATTDPLTGLANHRIFHDRLGAESARARRAGTPLGLVLIDLDHFKRVNDTHGHQAGDDVLREVARRLRDRSRQEDVVARVGGEELAWLLPGAGAAEAAEAAERLRADIRGAAFPGVGQVTASMGVAQHEDDGPAGLVRRADLALYRAKAGGRDSCVTWDDRTPVTAARSG